MFPKPIRSLACLLLLAPTGYAGDFYVDAVNGDNANTGASPALAWRTISHATATLGNSHTIHVAPGLYDRDLGESFPIQIGGMDRLIGSAGPEQTVLQGDGFGDLVHVVQAGTQPPLLEGFTLRDATRGVHCVVPQDSFRNLQLRNVAIKNMGAAGVSGDTLGSFGTAGLSVKIDDSIIRDCSTGVDLSSSASGLAIDSYVSFNATNTQFINNGVGISSSSDGSDVASAWVNLAGCRVGSSSNIGVQLANSSLFAQLSVFAHNLTATEAFFSGVTLRNCSVVENTTVFRLTGTHHTPTANLESSILWGNSTNIVGGTLIPSFCDLDSGPGIGSDGNFSADPLFWSEAIRDYHLKVGSPCIGAGNPAGSDVGAFPYDPNYAPEPLNYCQGGLNSVGLESAIGATGTPSMATNDFTLTSENNPPTVIGLFYYGSVRTNVPFGDGTGCVGGGIYRLSPPVMTSATGEASRLLDFTSAPAGSGPGAIAPGSSRHFQFWYRDPSGPGGSGFNLSNGITAWFLP